jgi:hypothetical protein
MDEKSLAGGVFKTIGLAALIVAVIVGLAYLPTRAKYFSAAPWLRVKCEGSRGSPTGRVEVLTGGQWQLALSPLQPALKVIHDDCAIVTSQEESTLLCKDRPVRRLEHDEVVWLSKQAVQAFDCNRH